MSRPRLPPPLGRRGAGRCGGFPHGSGVRRRLRAYARWWNRRGVVYPRCGTPEEDVGHCVW
eukprot:9116690-Lingulodinium_polyedra.AAC.1